MSPFWSICLSGVFYSTVTSLCVYDIGVSVCVCVCVPHTSAVSEHMFHGVISSLEVLKSRSLEVSHSSSDSEFYLCPAFYIHKILCHHGSLYEERLCVIFMKFHLAPGSSCLFLFLPLCSTHTTSTCWEKCNKKVSFYSTFLLF